MRSWHDFARPQVGTASRYRVEATIKANINMKTTQASACVLHPVVVPTLSTWTPSTAVSSFFATSIHTEQRCIALGACACAALPTHAATERYQEARRSARTSRKVWVFCLNHSRTGGGTQARQLVLRRRVAREGKLRRWGWHFSPGSVQVCRGWRRARGDEKVFGFPSGMMPFTTYYVPPFLSPPPRYGHRLSFLGLIRFLLKLELYGSI